jgi:hypothetical protein
VGLAADRLAGSIACSGAADTRGPLANALPDPLPLDLSPPAKPTRSVKTSNEMRQGSLAALPPSVSCLRRTCAQVANLSDGELELVLACPIGPVVARHQDGVRTAQWCAEVKSVEVRDIKSPYILLI